MSSSKKFVLDGAVCSCNKGSVQGKLKVTAQTKVRIQGKLKATEADKLFLPPFFGNCNKDPKTPCAPQLQKWQAITSKTTFAGAQQFLLEDSECMCSMGGKVVIDDHTQQHNPITPPKDEKNYPEVKGTCIAHFRPHYGFKFEFGFDWLRQNDYEGKGDIQYNKIMGAEYTIIKIKRGKQVSDSHFLIMYETFENYRDTNFQPVYDVPWIEEKEVETEEVEIPDPAVNNQRVKKTDIKVKEKYACPWLSLYSNETAELQLQIITKKEAGKLQPPKTLRLAYNKNMLSVKYNGAEGVAIENAEIAQAAYMVYIDLPVGTKEKYKIPGITVAFKDKKPIDGKETIRVLCNGEWAGQLNICPNNAAATRNVDVLFVSVKTGTADSQIGEKQHNFPKQKQKLESYLKQALVSVRNYESKELDISSEIFAKNFKDKFVIIVPQDPSDPGSAANPKVLTTKQDPANRSQEAFFTYLNAALQAQLGAGFARYANYHKVYFFGEEGMHGKDVIAGVARALPSMEAAVFIGKSENVSSGDDNTTIHEVLHCFGLYHTFQSDFSMKQETTDNIMDYCNVSKIPRISTFKYQWDKIKETIKL